MRRRILVILAVLLTATVALTAYYRKASGDSSPALTTAVVTRGDVVASVQATGTLEAVTTVQVGIWVTGTIASLHADYNSQVHKGQVIARLDRPVLQTQVEQGRGAAWRVQAEGER